MNFLNRHATWIYIAAGICIVCVLLLPYGKRLYDQIPKYEWDIKQMGSTKSKEPFGAKYLDEYLHDYWKGKLYVEADADTAFAKFGKRRANYLFVGFGYQLNDDYEGFDKLINMVNAGSRLLFAGTEYEIAEHLSIVSRGGARGNFDIHDFLDREDEIERISLQLNNRSDNSKPSSITVWENMATVSIGPIQNDTLQNDTLQDSIVNEYKEFYKDIPLGTYTSLIAMNDKWDVAARRDIGKGCITLSFNDHFLFTNYAVQNRELRIAMEHIMECTFDKSLPLIIIYNDYENEDGAEGTTFMVLLKHPATALFLWLLCAALALAIIFNTRRRRRPENENKKVQNSSINFIRHLATIYTDDTDYRELLRIEKRVLLYKLRKEFYFDMRTRNFSEVSQFASILAANRGLNEERVKEVLTTLEELTASGVQVDAKSYRLCLEQLDTIKIES